MPRALRVVPPRGPLASLTNYLVLTNVPVQTPIKVTVASSHINSVDAEITVSMANNTASLHLWRGRVVAVLVFLSFFKSY